MSHYSMIMEVNKNLSLMAKYRYPWLVGMPNYWPLIVQFLEAYTPLIHNTIVRWICPVVGSYKCNTNGSSKGNLNINTTSFCVRDDRGDLVVAQARRLDLCSALEAEVQAFKEGLLYCLNQNYTPLIMEIDSLVIKKILDGIWEVPWVISEEIRAMKRELENKDVTVVHTYREGNQLADF
uniref:Putative ovule protein n=1 Tax=Solanum chacoense TaxID=4108 RepID=A0A0V0I1K0_SOLCH